MPSLHPGHSRIWADGVRQVRHPFAIDAGRDTEFVLVLERCGVRTVTFLVPPDAPTPKWISRSLFDAQSQLVWGGNADCQSAPPLARSSAPPGSYTLMAGGEGGLGGQMALTITNLRSDEPALVVPLVRKR